MKKLHVCKMGLLFNFRSDSLNYETQVLGRYNYIPNVRIQHLAGKLHYHLKTCLLFVTVKKTSDQCCVCLLFHSILLVYLMTSGLSSFPISNYLALSACLSVCQSLCLSVSISLTQSAVYTEFY